MKKHLIAICIIVLVLAIGGISIWVFIQNKKAKTLYQAHCEFALGNDTNLLIEKMSTAQSLYPSETGLKILQTSIAKLDSFEADLNSYLMLSNTKNKTTKKMTKSYSSLNNSRAILITTYEEYIVRMSGNINAESPALKTLYSSLFDKTVKYLQQYNTTFITSSNYVFNNVCNVDTIKPEVYTLYSLGVNNLLSNLSGVKFADLSLITRLNNGIKLSNGNISIKSSVYGGEFSEEAFSFKRYFNSCNHSTLIDNFNTYYNTSINVSLETSNEKLAIYYAKKILEI